MDQGGYKAIEYNKTPGNKEQLLGLSKTNEKFSNAIESQIRDIFETKEEQDESLSQSSKDALSLAKKIAFNTPESKEALVDLAIALMSGAEDDSKAAKDKLLNAYNESLKNSETGKKINFDIYSLGNISKTLGKTGSLLMKNYNLAPRLDAVGI